MSGIVDFFTERYSGNGRLALATAAAVGGSCHVLGADVKTTAICSVAAAASSQFFPNETHNLCRLFTAISYGMAFNQEKKSGDLWDQVKPFAAGVGAAMTYSIVAGPLSRIQFQISNPANAEFQAHLSLMPADHLPLSCVLWNLDHHGNCKFKVYLANPMSDSAMLSVGQNAPDSNNGAAVLSMRDKGRFYWQQYRQEVPQDDDEWKPFQ